MPIKLAISTVSCPDWPLEEAAKRAVEMGYHGLELRTLGHGDARLASDPALTTPAKTRDILKAFGVECVGLSTSISLHHRASSPQRDAAYAAQQAVELAAEIGAPGVRLFAYDVDPGVTRQSVMLQIAQQVKPIADHAADRGVQVWFENAGSFTRAKEWWWLFNLFDHPMVGMVWNVATAAAAGEPPAVSVPTLGSRIRLAKVKDLEVGVGAGYTRLGEGSVGVDKFIRRLLGIGFDGYVSVEHDRLWLPALEDAADYLPDAASKLKAWIADASAAIEQADAAAKKAAAKVKLTPAAPVRA